MHLLCSSSPALEGMWPLPPLRHHRILKGQKLVSAAPPGASAGRVLFSQALVLPISSLYLEARRLFKPEIIFPLLVQAAHSTSKIYSTEKRQKIGKA